MRHWLPPGLFFVLMLVGVAAPASATPVAFFDWSVDNQWFELLNTSTLVDGGGNPFPALLDPQIELNRDSSLLLDLVGDPSDPSGIQSVISPGFAANTVAGLDLATITSVQLIFGGALPPGVLTTSYFTLTDAGAVAATEWTGIDDFAVVDYQPVPEPGTLALFASGFAAFWGARRRSAKKA
jgi:hypothetical protein